MAFLEIDSAQIEGISDALDATQPQMETALSRAINRVVASVRGRFGRILAAEAGLKGKDFLDHRVYADKAGKGRLRGSIWFGTGVVSLRHYKNAQDKTGVSVSLGQRGRVEIPHAFNAGKFKSNVFIRNKWLGGLPDGITDAEGDFGLRKVTRLAHAWDGGKKGEAALAAAMSFASDRLPIEFEHELRHVLQKY
jgi:hypothetical protein